MFQKTIIGLCLIAFAAGCATTQSKPDPFAGIWDYELHYLPQGEPLGIMTIQKTEDGYSVVMKGSNVTNDGNSLIDPAIKDNALTSGHFFAQGYKINVTGTFDGNEFEGMLDAEGNTFRMTAVKQE